MKGFKSVFQQRFNELLELEKIKDAALKTGLAVNTLYAYLYGKAMPRAERLGRIAAGYGVSADWLAGRIDERQEAVRRLPAAGCRVPGKIYREAQFPYRRTKQQGNSRKQRFL